MENNNKSSVDLKPNKRDPLKEVKGPHATSVSVSLKKEIYQNNEKQLYRFERDKRNATPIGDEVIVEKGKQEVGEGKRGSRPSLG